MNIDTIPRAETNSPPLLTPQALCAQLSISYRSYSRLVRAGMPYVPMLTARRYDLAEVTAWLRAQAGHGAASSMPRWKPNDDNLTRHLKMLVPRGVKHPLSTKGR